MAKKQALLFELMKEDENPQVKKGLLDHLFRKSDAPQEQKADGTKETTQVSETAAASEIQETDEQELKVYVRVNTFTKVIAGTLVVLIFFCGFVLGKKIGWRAGVGVRSVDQMENVSNKVPEPQVMNFDTQDVPVKQQAPVAQQVSQAAEKPQTAGDFSRKSGVNYLIIQNFKELADAEKARDFLSSKGVQSTVEQYKTQYILMSVNGYLSLKEARTESDSFKAQIRALGQQYRQRAEAKDYSFKDCYYYKWP